MMQTGTLKVRNIKNISNYRNLGERMLLIQDSEWKQGRFEVKEGHGAYKLDTDYKKTGWIGMRVRKGNHKRKYIKTGSRV